MKMVRRRWLAQYTGQPSPANFLYQHHLLSPCQYSDISGTGPLVL